jgi:hypothetical protein
MLALAFLGGKTTAWSRVNNRKLRGDSVMAMKAMGIS